MRHAVSIPERKVGLACRMFCLVLRRVLVTGALMASPSVPAAHLGVSPTLLDVGAGEAVAGLRISNGDPAQPVSVQARLMRWHQDAGEDVLVPAVGVMVSPPIARVQPGAENLIRIVRTDKTPVTGEEAYRLLLDQLPEPGAQAAGTVSILIRHSVPVFFAGVDAAPAQVQWRIERVRQADAQAQQSGWRVTVTNTGSQRLRLANLDLQDEAGHVVGQSPGLLGYVLGHSTMAFFVPEDQALAQPPQRLRIVMRDAAGTIETALLPLVAP